MKQEMRKIYYITLLIFILLQTLICHGQQTGCPISRFADSVNNFGASMLRFIRPQQNAVISTIGLYKALAILYNGARGVTANRLESVLFFDRSGLDKGLLNEGIQKYLTDIKSGDGRNNLQVKNTVFIAKDCSLKRQFTEDLRTYYQSIVKEEDFEFDVQGVRNRINNFIANETQQNVQNFFKQSFRPKTLLVFVNVIYFQGSWDFLFNNRTNGTFYNLDGTQQTVTFLHYNRGTFRYYEDGFRKYLELPYKGGQFSLVLALPKSRGSSPYLRMTTSLYCRVRAGWVTIDLSLVVIPEFKIQFRTDLVNALKNMGMGNLLEYGTDLSGISDDFGSLKVAAMAHETEIEFQVIGSKASAANRGHARSSNQAAPHAYTFNVSHPFAFYVIDKKNGVVLYSGHIHKIVQ